MNEQDKAAFERAFRENNWWDNPDAEEIWQLALAHRDSQPAQEPVAEVTHNNTNCIGWNPKFNPLAMEDRTPLYTAPPAAAINEQLLEALKVAECELLSYRSKAQWENYRKESLDIVIDAIAVAEKAKGGV